MGITQEKGSYSESKACDFLISKGLKLMTRNYNCKHGEIDLIMQDKDFIVFVEVRYRNNDDYGGSLASIRPSKISKLKRAATHYLLSENKYDKVSCRFDVVALSSNQQNPHIEWIQNAIVEGFKS